MHKTILFAGLLLLLVVAFAFTRSDIPEIVYDYEPVGEAVTLDFKVNKLNTEGLELALKGQSMFIKFAVAMEGTRPVVTMESLTGRSAMEAPAPPRRPASEFPFLKDAGEKPVLNFTFENQLAQDPKGNLAMRMTYTGVRVPLVETLVVKKAMTLPASVGERFESSAGIEFQPGTYYLDKKIQGFWIPVKKVEIK